MDKAGQPVPVILGLRIRQSNMPVKVVFLCSKTVVVLDIKHFTERASAIPKADLSVAVESL